MNMIMIATLTSIMFLGGWLSPLALAHAIDIAGFHPFGDGLPWLFAKLCAVLFIFLWIRATWPGIDTTRSCGWLEGVHPVDAGMDRVPRRDDADAVGGPVPLKEDPPMLTRLRFFQHLATARAGCRD